MIKSTTKSTFVKSMMYAFGVVMLAMCVILLSACGGNATAPMELSGKTLTTDYEKTDYVWGESATEEEKQKIIRGMTESPLTFVFNADGSAEGLAFFDNDETQEIRVVYYTQDSSTIKFFNDAEKTTQCETPEGVTMEFTVKSDCLAIKFTIPNAAPTDTISGYTIYLYDVK